MSRVTSAAAVAVILLIAAGHAQQPAQSPTAQQPTFGAGTAAVVVDVIVRDKSGRPVTDLAASDFQLFEDEVPQEIGNVSLVAPAPSTVGAAAVPTAPAAAPTVASNTVTAPTFVAIVFDRLSNEGRAMAHRGAQAYLETARDNDFAGVFVVSNGLEMVHTYTTDRTALRKALDDAASRATANFNSNNDRILSGVLGDRNPRTSMTASAEERGPVTGATPTNPGGPIPQISTPGQASQASASSAADVILTRMVNRMERSYEAMMRDEQGYATTNALLALIDSLSLLPGRKTVVFFAEGLAIPAAVQARFDSLVATANRANVSIYTIDSAGLRVHSEQTATAGNVNALGNAALDRDPEAGGKLVENLEFNEDNLRRDPSVSLKMLAERTGGFLINNTNNLARGFQTIDADRRFHYLVTYAPKNANFRGEWRRISVTVPTRDVQIRARTGYLAVRSASAVPLLAYEAPAAAALDTSPLPTAVPVRAAAFSMPDAKSAGRLALLVAADAASLTFKPSAAKDAWSTDFTILARIKDAGGQVVRKASQPYRLTGPTAQLQSAQRGDVLFFRQPDLPPGTYTLEAVVHDALGGKAGATTSSIVVPEVKPGALTVSSLLLVRRTETLPAGEKADDNPLYLGDLLLYPSLGEPFRKSVDKALSFFLRIHPAAAAPASTAVLELIQGTQGIGKVPIELAKPNARGAIEQSSQLPLANFPAGAYGLRITVTQGSESLVREAKFTVVD